MRGKIDFYLTAPTGSRTFVMPWGGSVMEPEIIPDEPDPDNAGEGSKASNPSTSRETIPHTYQKCERV